MKITIKILALLFSFFLLNSCDKKETPPKKDSPTVNKIMPLGASRVEGNRPSYESFRFETWKDLIENGWTVDFIGTQTDIGTYTPVGGKTFDGNHEGRGGWTSKEILGGLSNWLSQTDTPDIVLFSSPGGNDALDDLPFSEAVANINSIIDTLQANNPNVTILIEQMAPGHSAIVTPELKTYFENLQKEVVTIATNHTTATSKVIAVDMFTGFTDAMLADPVHYNEKGAIFVAERYYDVLKDILRE